MQTPIGDWVFQEEFQMDYLTNPRDRDKKRGSGVKEQPGDKEAGCTQNGIGDT